MGIEAKLERWRAAGLIDERAREGILRYEAEHARPNGIFYVTGLGALAIALGLVAIVASNWQGIPAWSKLAALFLSAAGLAFAIVRQRSKPKPSFWVLDTLIVVYSGLVIAGIGLIGQIHQLHGNLANPLLVWTAAITPLVFHSLGYFVPVHWALLVLVSATVWIFEYIDKHGAIAPLYVALAAFMSLPLLFIGLGIWPRLRERLPNFSKAFAGIGWAYLVAIGSLGQALWYFDRAFSEARDGAPAGLGLTLLALALFFGLSFRAPTRRLSLGASGLLLFCLLSPYLSWFFGARSELLAALGFMTLWALVARCAYEQRSSGLFKAATSLIGLRLFILYSQTLGGFLASGFGLLLSGVLLIVGVRLWHTRSRDFTKGWGRHS
jgi:uncharacterized membrane protein